VTLAPSTQRLRQAKGEKGARFEGWTEASAARLLLGMGIDPALARTGLTSDAPLGSARDAEGAPPALFDIETGNPTSGQEGGSEEGGFAGKDHIAIHLDRVYRGMRSALC